MSQVDRKAEQLQIRVTAEQKAAIRRAARRAGMDMSSWVLSRTLPAPQRSFAELVERLRCARERPSYVLAEINDWLASLRGDELVVAVADPPLERQLGDYLANYLAAMIEVTCHRKGVPPPGWAAAVAPLARPVFGSPLVGLRLWLLTHAPVPFRRRNIFIDATVGDRV